MSKKFTAPNGGVAITDLNAVKAFYLSVIPKPTQSMPGVHTIAGAPAHADKRLAESGFPAAEFEGATLFFRRAIWTGKPRQSRSVNFHYRLDADGWKLTEIEKCMASSEIFDRIRIRVTNPELQAILSQSNM
ncbi:hypothetical protein [Rhizobium sp. RU36D]|uniref:hypothetical protein n=1 Tax=Rhizobium sp. RU36D TaxID=1907415 RepID=UPI0009D86993|nr:hypothetical protein [Rhizobium sp. RU36D]SMD16333.1 hypothetical protein SAMN05880593_12946 [Rhizobium sp. RU36D]